VNDLDLILSRLNDLGESALAVAALLHEARHRIDLVFGQG
jgi:hypothetical protein